MNESDEIQVMKCHPVFTGPVDCILNLDTYACKNGVRSIKITVNDKEFVFDKIQVERLLEKLLLISQGKRI